MARIETTSWLVGIALVACSSGSPAPARLELVDAPERGAVAPIVTSELVRARRDGKQLLVYVGASWCEPCQHFHDAAIAGELDATLGDVRMLVFDLDRDSARLEAAHYTSALIPLFAVPRDDGTGSDRHIEGSIKGGGAVGQITPRVRRLLDRQ